MRTNYETKDGNQMEVRLHDANGMHVGSMDADAEPMPDGVVESGGKLYIWNQRNSQWREASGVAKSKFEKVAEAPREVSVPKGEDGTSAPKK